VGVASGGDRDRPWDLWDCDGCGEMELDGVVLVLMGVIPQVVAWAG